MKEKLLKIREPKPIKSRAKSALISVMIFIIGAVLGVFSKWLDNLSLDSSVGWQRILEILDLRNVFSEMAVWILGALIISVFSTSAKKSALNAFLFFAGMCAAYHIYTVLFSGFNPAGYMMIWYAVTLASPLFAVVCWYGKGRGAAAAVINVLILSVLANFCFSIGWLYFGFNGIINLLIFIAAVIVLYNNPKQTAISLAVSIPAAVLISGFIPF